MPIESSRLRAPEPETRPAKKIVARRVQLEPPGTAEARGAPRGDENGVRGIVHRARENFLPCRLSGGWRNLYPAVNPPLPVVDADLFEAIQANREGWKFLSFRRYRSSVANLVFRRLGTSADADDIVNDVFLRFFERAAHVREAANLRAYVLSIARHVICEELEKRTRQRTTFGVLEHDFDAAFSSDDPAAGAALRELDTILDRLRDQDRHAYLLRKVAGLGLEGVAEALGISPSTTQRRIAAASEFVRKSASRSALLSEYARRSSKPSLQRLTTPR